MLKADSAFLCEVTVLPLSYSVKIQQHWFFYHLVSTHMNLTQNIELIILTKY